MAVDQPFTEPTAVLRDAAVTDSNYSSAVTTGTTG